MMGKNVLGSIPPYRVFLSTQVIELAEKNELCVKKNCGFLDLW